MVTIRPSMPGDCWLVLPNLRVQEVAELEALGVSSEHCIRFGLLYGNAHTGFINGEAAGIFGIMDYGDVRVPWGVFTTVIEKHPIAFLRAAKRFLRGVEGLQQYVDVRNALAVKWFAWLGFEVGTPEHIGLNGEAFHRVIH